jgi:hypothetical protein
MTERISIPTGVIGPFLQPAGAKSIERNPMEYLRALKLSSREKEKLNPRLCKKYYEQDAHNAFSYHNIFSHILYIEGEIILITAAFSAFFL